MQSFGGVFGALALGFLHLIVEVPPECIGVVWSDILVSDAGTLNFIYAPKINAAALSKASLLQGEGAHYWVNIRELSPVSRFVCK